IRVPYAADVEPVSHGCQQLCLVDPTARLHYDVSCICAWICIEPACCSLAQPIGAARREVPFRFQEGRSQLRIPALIAHQAMTVIKSREQADQPATVDQF